MAMRSALAVNALALKDDDGRTQIPAFEIPDRCPICHRSIAPVFIATSCHRLREHAQVAFRCADARCDRVFVALYDWDEPRSRYVLEKTEPVYPESRSFGASIAGLSPMFEVIYNQALAAEAAGLREVCGCGYRRALEFLVKDYLTASLPQDATAIRSELLGACIAHRVSEPRLKECAERAAWLGNDETHYERRWTGTDLQDLKVLIDLALHWVESEVLHREYLARMPKQ
jgi:hypothetical protein